MAEAPSALAPETVAPRSARDWSGVAALLAAMIGFLALLVSGYTAYVQRQQVRAQVWPFIGAGDDDNGQSLVAYSKGVGPAIVRSAQILVDGKPQRDWDAVLDALGVAAPRAYAQSTINPNVLSPGEHVSMIKFQDKDAWERFRNAALGRLTINLCYCSTLDECWTYRDPQLVGHKAATSVVQPAEQCAQTAPGEAFSN